MNRFMSERAFQNLLGMSLFILLCFGCSSVEVRTKYDRSVDFSKYQSFAWRVPEQGEEQHLPNVNIDVKENIIRAVNQQMKIKGFERVSPEEADIVLNAEGSIKDKAIREVEAHYNYEPLIGDADYEGRDPGGPTGGYRRGTMILNMLDAQSGKRIWHGKVSGVVNEAASSEQEVEKFVGKLMKRFPPSGE